MNYRIIPTREFIKDFGRLDFLLAKRVKKKIEEVALDPARYKHLRPPLNNYSRVRIDKLRLIFSYDVERMELYPEKIVFKHRY